MGFGSSKISEIKSKKIDGYYFNKLMIIIFGYNKLMICYIVHTIYIFNLLINGWYYSVWVYFGYKAKLLHSKVSW